MPIVETRAITGGVDTHADTHVAAALDPVGGLLGVREFPVTAAGYTGLLGWMGGFGTVCLVGIEGTGSYGAGLARHMSAAGVRVVEVDRSDRQDRRRQGKSDPLDAVSAARAAQSGRARGAPKGRDGAVEAVRALMVAKRSARSERTQAINQARALIVTGPEDLRARFAAHATADLVAELAALRPRPGAVVGYHTRIALRELGRRAEFPGSQILCLDALIVPLVTGHAGILNDQGLTSGEGNPFHPLTVARICRAYQLRSRHQRLRDAGLLTLHETAATLGVSAGTVKIWYHAGIVSGERYNDKGQVLYHPPGPNPPTPHQGTPLHTRPPAQTPQQADESTARGAM